MYYLDIHVEKEMFSLIRVETGSLLREYSSSYGVSNLCDAVRYTLYEGPSCVAHICDKFAEKLEELNQLETSDFYKKHYYIQVVDMKNGMILQTVFG